MVRQQGLVKVYARGGLYIHMLQQDLRDTTRILPGAAVSQDMHYRT